MEFASTDELVADEYVWEKELRAKKTIEKGARWYPKGLLALGDTAPDRLWAVGNVSLLADSRKLVAVTGPARATDDALRNAQSLSGALAAACAPAKLLATGARGVDEAVVEEYLNVLENDPLFVVPPVVFIGYGLDHLDAEPYPKGWGPLFSRVINDDGCIVTAEKLETPPMPYGFKRRRSLAAAMADLVVCVECARQSGSYGMVQEAQRYNTRCACLPGPFGKPECAGTNAMIAAGMPCIDSDDAFTDLLFEICGGDAR